MPSYNGLELKYEGRFFLGSFDIDGLDRGK